MAWGDGTWGEGSWGSIETTEENVFDLIGRGRNIREAESQWTSSIDFARGSNTHGLVRALLTSTDRTDEDIEDVYNETHIDSASGENLDKMGQLVDVRRRSTDDDALYRYRIKSQLIASTTGTTYDQFVEFTASLVDADASNVEIDADYEGTPGVPTVFIGSTALQNAPLSDEQIVEFLQNAVPAGHTVSAVEEGSFVLKADGETDDPQMGLTSDSIETGGVLASDIA